MDIFNNLNGRLTIEKMWGVCPGGEEYIEKILHESPVKLPEDYINLLKIISGDENAGISSQVDGGNKEICIYSAKLALERRIYEFSLPLYEGFNDATWLIGDNVGETLYFYGEGKEGFGIYKTDAAMVDIDYAEKIADSLTGFLVDGVGIEVALT